MDEFDREAPLFDGKVRVLVQQPERDDRHTFLTVRMLNGQRTLNSNQKERVLRIEVTDDEELETFFLYVWSVSEEEFHDLKHQQRLLVDFPKFATNFMDLLTCCLAKPTILHESSSNHRPEGQAPLSYLAVLNTHDTAGHSTFSIVETNAFKRLTHLSLQFTPGDDAEVKLYLAARLRQTTHEKRRLQQDLATTTSDLNAAKKSESELKTQVDHAAQQHSEQLGQAKMAYSDEMTAQKEAALATLHETERMYSAKLESLRISSKDEIEQLQRNLAESQATIQSLQKTKYQHEIKLEQLELHVAQLEKSNQQHADELQALKDQNKALDHDVFTKEKLLNQSDLRIAALQQQVADKEDVIQKSTELLQASSNHKLEIEETLTMYKANNSTMQQKLELSISEINKGNQIIEQMHSENQAMKAKLRMKSKILKQQDLIVQEKEHQRDQLMHQLKALKNELLLRDDQIALVQSKNDDLAQKLDESNKLLASNQQVITWLNKEINEAQLSSHKRSAYSTAFTFHPPSATTLGPSANPATSSLLDRDLPQRYGMSTASRLGANS
ncbi:hypothetical protein H310_07871 [Aphanomyces invadans]|uniref:Spindle assembly abnormal protein 6 N-terminal domain-containing protein n=1 Tax=Aphanomyces invadans TaxID=157072 RepID=A0A024U0T8_9STRA|nr:hypothetical protein H310_07871 [Aphanomyces invadans]ETV99829.1 hypothetical protein H310_07871 [Aphanomyces invadans]|eukprot:XP_008871605.1 hypothetical protein H310_07871 [Aphanomyces invadans]